MLLCSWFFISLIFTESAQEETAVPRRNAKTIEAYITYYENSQPNNVEITVDPNALTTEGFTHKKQRLIYNLYKNVLEKQREQRENNSKHTLIHRKRRDIEHLKVEKTTQKELYRDIYKVEKLTKNENTKELSREIDRLDIEKTRYNVTPIKHSGEIYKLKVEKTSHNATTKGLYREMETLANERTTHNRTIKEVFRRMYTPMRIAGSRNNATNFKMSTKKSLRQRNIQTEKAKDVFKNALDKVIRLRSANLTTTRKKSTMKIVKPYEMIKHMISYKRRSSRE